MGKYLPQQISTHTKMIKQLQTQIVSLILIQPKLLHIDQSEKRPGKYLPRKMLNQIKQ